jgi:hypothetical protein
VALRREIVDLVGLHLLHKPDEIDGVGQIALMHAKARGTDMRILIEVIDAFGVEGRGPPLDAIYAVARATEQLREIGPVLPRYAGNKCDLFRQTKLLQLGVLSSCPVAEKYRSFPRRPASLPAKGTNLGRT